MNLFAVTIILITWNWKPSCFWFWDLPSNVNFATVGPTSHNYKISVKLYFWVSSINFLRPVLRSFRAGHGYPWLVVCPNALQRFISHRGQPEMIWSDNGTKFVGAERESTGFLHSSTDCYPGGCPCGAGCCRCCYCWLSGDCESLRAALLPRPSIIVAGRYKFRQWAQHPGEPVENYISALRALAAICEFGALHDDLIRDQLVEVYCYNVTSMCYPYSGKDSG